MAKILKDASGNDVMREGKEVYITSPQDQDLKVIKGVNPDKRELTIIGTDETQDREGDIIMMNGWNLKNFLNNPVFLWVHDYGSVPLASATKVVRKKLPHPHMVFTEKFPTEGINPFADMIFELYKEKIINACSVGFHPTKWEKIDDLEDDGFFNYAPRRFLKQELLELSGCPVPCNPGALQLAIKGFDIPKGVNSDKAVDLLMGKIVPEIEKRDDVYNELGAFSKGIQFVDETEATVHQVPDDLENKTEDKEIDEDGEIIEEKVETDTETITVPEDKDVDPIEEIIIDDTKWVYLGTKESNYMLGDENHTIVVAIPKDILPTEQPQTIVEEKSGAVLNKKNKTNLKEAMTLIQTVLDSSETEEDTGGLDDKSGVQAIANESPQDNIFKTILSNEKITPSAAKDEELDLKPLIKAFKELVDAINKTA